jgi:hypothetical protein
MKASRPQEIKLAAQQDETYGRSNSVDNVNMRGYT